MYSVPILLAGGGVIVSLTSFPKRIGNVWQVVVCLLQQTILPSKIFLWLSKDQFKTEDDIPIHLLSMQNDIFEIRLVDGDARSHKKYLYVCREYPDSLVFLVDDDIYYPTDILEKSLNVYKKYPHSIVCNYGAQIRFDSKGRHLPYSQWGKMYDDNIGC